MDVLLEGSDDERFVDAVIRPILEKHYDYVQTWRYAGEKSERTKNYLRSVRAMKADSLFLKDINRSPCVTAIKKATEKRYKKVLDPATVTVVIPEIESWYLAGLDDGSCERLGLSKLPHTDDINKEHFGKMMPAKAVRIDFMIEILKNFSVETAIRKNKSFAYLMKKLQGRFEKV